MSYFFKCISQVLSDDDLDIVDQNYEYFLDHVKQNLVDDDEDHIHPPVPVYSYIRPKIVVKFILNVIIPMVGF